MLLFNPWPSKQSILKTFASRTLLIGAFLAAVLPTVPCWAAEGEFQLGVAAHLGRDNADQLRNESYRLEQLGIDSVRDDLPWSRIEQYDGKEPVPAAISAFRYVNQALNKNIKPLYILDIGNERYDAGGLPVSAAAQGAYVNFVAKSVSLTRLQSPRYEFWNEWNIGGGSRRSQLGSSIDYVRLVHSAYQAAKKLAPEAIFLAGVVGEDTPKWPWMMSAVEAGLLRNADGLSIHLYNHCASVPTRTAAEAVSRLRALHDLLEAAHYRNEPIYVTEVGWPTKPSTASPKACGVSEGQAADNLAQFLLSTAALPYVRGVWIYELSDEGRNPTDLQQNFGLYRQDGEPKRSACVVRELLPILSSRTSAKMVRLSKSVIRVDLWGQAGHVVALWNEGVAPMWLGANTRGDARVVCGASFGAKDRIPITSSPVVFKLPKDVDLRADFQG